MVCYNLSSLTTLWGLCDYFFFLRSYILNWLTSPRTYSYYLRGKKNWENVFLHLDERRRGTVRIAGAWTIWTGHWEEDGGNSLLVCLSKTEMYLYYNFRESEEYQTKQQSLFSSHKLWNAGLKFLKLKIRRRRITKTKAQNDRGDNSYYLKIVPIFPPFPPTNEKAFEAK